MSATSRPTCGNVLDHDLVDDVGDLEADLWQRPPVVVADLDHQRRALRQSGRCRLSGQRHRQAVPGHLGRGCRGPLDHRLGVPELGPDGGRGDDVLGRARHDGRIVVTGGRPGPRTRCLRGPGDLRRRGRRRCPRGIRRRCRSVGTRRRSGRRRAAQPAAFAFAFVTAAGSRGQEQEGTSGKPDAHYASPSAASRRSTGGWAAVAVSGEPPGWSTQRWALATGADGTAEPSPARERSARWRPGG